MPVNRIYNTESSSSRKKVLFITTKSEVGGVQKFVKEQIDICSNSFDIYLSTNKKGWLTEEIETKTKGVLLNSSIESKLSLFFLFRLFRFIKKNNIDLVIANSANAGFYGRVAAFFAGKKSCYFSHGWSSVYNGGNISFILNKIEKILSAISDKVICVSQNDYKVGITKIGVNKSKLLVIKNATLPTFNQHQAQSNIQHLKVICLTRFAKPKRVDLMIKAFVQINNATLHIAGSGPEFEKYNTYINSNKIENVKLLGEIQSFTDFDKYDTFMLISDSEGLPISAIEAMSAGLPLILSNVGGCPELISNNGVLVENNDASIQKGIQEILDNYEVFHKNSLKLYEDNFNLNNTKEKYRKLYDSLITGN